MSLLSNLANKVSGALKEGYTKVVAPPTESKFLEKGILTPKEFIEAGDQLVVNCSSWSWKRAVDDKHKKSDLPDDKQFLYTRVPCRKRVRDGIELKAVEKDLGDGWSLAGEESDVNGTGEKETVNKLAAMNLEDLQGTPETKEEKYVMEDEDGIQVKVSANQAEENKEDDDDDFIAVTQPISSEIRLYELTITYDFYYLTPRLWLAGYTDDNTPLTAKEMFEDIMDDYANKTVTYETHPHIGVNQLSIHPCKHANVMKHLIDLAAENGAKIEPHQAMFVLLKFISSVVPTMEYDLSVDFLLSKA